MCPTLKHRVGWMLLSNFTYILGKPLRTPDAFRHQIEDSQQQKKKKEKESKVCRKECMITGIGYLSWGMWTNISQVLAASQSQSKAI